MAQDTGELVETTPSTFLERGVAVPFTTPNISGARIRPGQRHALELLIPNPSGGRGNYVLSMDRLDSYCRETVHDRALSKRIQATRVVTPSSIRKAARIVAGQGLAGRGAAAAAAAADRAEERDRLLMNFNLMLELVQAVEGPNDTGRLQVASAEEIERRARAAVAKIAPSFGSEAAEINQVLEELAADFARIGRGPTAAQARLPETLDRLVALRRELLAWARPATRPGADLAQLVIDVASATIDIAGETLKDARAEAQHVLVMLRARFMEPERVCGLLARPDWLLDGWDIIGLLWTMPGDNPPEVRLAEMVALLPLLPREASRWTTALFDTEALGLRSRSVAMNVDWRSAQPVFDQVAQNEKRRALAA